MDEPGVPLEHYLQHAGVGVRFICRACARSFDVPIGEVIAGLERRGRGGRRTGIRAVAATLTRPCAACGARKWETRPAFPAGRPG